MENLTLSVHIPKTGGTTFMHTISQILSDRLLIDNGDHPESPAYALNRIRKIKVDAWRYLYVKKLIKKDPATPIMIHGHFLPKKYSTFFPRAKRIIWLREPSQRIVSHYHYWKREPEMKHLVCRRFINEELNLNNFIDLKPLFNLQSLYFNGMPLSFFDFIGITEKFDRSIKLFNKMILPSIEISNFESLNVNPFKGKSYDLDDSLKKVIKKNNQKDYLLYEKANEYFENLCSIYKV